MVTALAVGAAGLGGMIEASSTDSQPGGFMPLGVIGILLLISGPSMILAWLKLRNRNLGPLLDANGWAINTRARINVPFGTSLTSLASLPPGSQRDPHGSYADKANPWPKILIFLIVLGLAGAVLNRKGIPPQVDRIRHGGQPGDEVGHRHQRPGCRATLTRPGRVLPLAFPRTAARLGVQ